MMILTVIVCMNVLQLGYGFNNYRKYCPDLYHCLKLIIIMTVAMITMINLYTALGKIYTEQHL